MKFQMIEDLKKSKETKKRIRSEIGNPHGDPFDADDDEEEEGEERRKLIVILLQEQPPGLDPL